ncbi:MAG TPA: phosphatase PAP2 family protein [Arthrobacter sp.]|nr:phosphatase PAP2 family protein [Arthrobacter sp.]
MQPVLEDRRTVRFAAAVTQVFSPVLLVSAYLLLLPLRADAVTWLQALSAACFTTGIPWVFVIWMKHGGHVTDLHVGNRAQRWPVFVFAAVSLLFGVAAELMLDAPPAVFASLALVLAGLVICAVVNLRWKLSVHTAVAAFIWLSAFATYPWGPAAALFLTMLVGWSRIEVRDHNPAQVLTGSLVGCLVFTGGLLLA